MRMEQCALGRFKRLEPPHGTGDPLHAAMVLLNGMITKDKFCLIRHCQVQLRWSRQPYRFRVVGQFAVNIQFMVD
jgi:hypothetical protein